jgi:hypothetical protein
MAAVITPPKMQNDWAPENLSALTASYPTAQNPRSAGIQAPAAAAYAFVEPTAYAAADIGQKEMKATHE